MRLSRKQGGQNQIVLRAQTRTGTTMLQKLANEITQCLQHSATAKDRAG